MKKLPIFIYGFLSAVVIIPVIDMVIQNTELVSENIKAKLTLKLIKSNAEISKAQESLEKTDTYAIGYDLNVPDDDYEDYDDDEDKLSSKTSKNKFKIGF